MITTERVSLADIIPDPNNPRKKFEGIPELAASFAVNADRPGEPVNPPLLVKDGSKYRIVDGERRYRAMAMAKTESCLANVADGMDDANAMLAMVATDDKQPLSDVEKSRGVQQMLLVGVDPEAVEKSANLRKGTAKKVMKAIKAAKEEAETMSIDRLMAISEFEGDEEAVRKLIECGEGLLNSVLYQLRSARERDEKKAALAKVLEERGVEAVEARPEGFTYRICLGDPDELAKHLDEKGSGFKAVISTYQYSPVSVSLYEPEEEREEDPEELERRREREEKQRKRDVHAAAYSAGTERRMRWVAERCANPSDLPNLAADAEADEGRFGGFYGLEEVLEFVGEDVRLPAGPAEILLRAWGLDYSNYGLLDWSGDHAEDACRCYVRLIDLIESDGYEPDESETAIYKEAAKALEVAAEEAGE